MPRSLPLLTRPGSLALALLAVSDLAYRLFVREPVRRALGIEEREPAAPPPVRRRRA